MKSTEIRDHFLKFFERHGHSIVPSSSLVPGNDPTLLFTNAGMVQFKDVFLGQEKRPYARAASSQRCVRAGGKHNDLENVGYTARHHTFFEMLGNFSFGDYFKRDAIRYAWEFLTAGHETAGRAAVGHGLQGRRRSGRHLAQGDRGRSRSASRASAQSSNFWPMGDTGPCGPCSEIFYDHGPAVAGGPPGSPDEDGDRYIEIWNLVFMQFNRDADGQAAPAAQTVGRYRHGPGAPRGGDAGRAQQLRDRPVPEPDRCGRRHCSATTDRQNNSLTRDRRSHPLLRLPDRRRRAAVATKAAATCCAASSAAPSATATSSAPRAAVLPQAGRAAGGGDGRRLSGTRHGQDPGRARPAPGRRALRRDAGTRHEMLEDDIAELGGTTVIPGETVFKLYDTYGFPVDLTADIARERGLTLDMAGFERAMDAQRERARAASQFHGVALASLASQARSGTRVHRLRPARTTRRRVTALIPDGTAPCEELEAGEEGIVVLDHTPFYAESGGQVGDSGWLVAAGARVRGARHPEAGRRRSGHIGTLDAGHAARCGDERRGARSTRPGAQHRAAITPRPTCCTPRCARCSARMCSRRARWSTPSACASTSPTSSR